MVTLTRTNLTHSAIRPRAVLWLATATVLVSLLALLSIFIKNNPFPSQDLAALDWVTGWDIPGLNGFFGAISFMTSSKAGLIYGPAVMALLLILRKVRATLVFAAIGAIVALVTVLGDYTLGEVIGRTRPVGDSPMPSFPSGHVFGSTFFFGFMGFLAIRYRMKKRLLFPMLGLFAILILAVGPARIYEQAHWPSDVVAGYILGALWLLIIIPTFLYFQRITSASSTASTKASSDTGP